MDKYELVMWAWKQRNLTSSAKLLLLSLVINSDENLVTPMKQREFVEELELGPATVARLLRELEDKGYISRQRRTVPGHRWNNEYHLHIR